jgi:hypothetical protein
MAERGAPARTGWNVSCTGPGPGRPARPRRDGRMAEAANGA